MPFDQFKHVAKKSQPSPETPDKKKPLILIIDDDEEVLEGLTFNLQQHYTVCACASSEEGLMHLDQNVQTVILDIKMPGKDGFQVYEEIKATFPHLPVIFYSAYQDILEAAKLSMKYMPFSFFDKSDDIQELLAAVDSAVHYAQEIKDAATG